MASTQESGGGPSGYMETTLLDVLGIRTVNIPDLPAPGILVRRYRLALIDSGLDVVDRETVIDRLFWTALDAEP